MIRTLQGDGGILASLNAPLTLVLVGAGTETAEVPGITVAGLPGYIPYTPALDFEVLHYGAPRSLPHIALSPDGPPSPILITAALAQKLHIPFLCVNVGLKIAPQAPCIHIPATPGGSILSGAQIDSERLFDEGTRLAEALSCLQGAVLLGECVPGGTTTAYALMRALGYPCKGHFSSSTQKESTRTLKEQLVEKALALHGGGPWEPHEALRRFGDPMQPFVAGFAARRSADAPLFLCGGTQMAAVAAWMAHLGVLPKQHIGLLTTRWIAHDSHSDISGLLRMAAPSLPAFFADFGFGASRHGVLRLYEEGLVKEGVAAGALLCTALAQGMNEAEIIELIDGIMDGLL